MAENPAPMIGGQAVLEGVMMRGRRHWVVSVRRPDGSIAAQERPVPSWSGRLKFLRWPFVRGTLTLIETVSLAIKALTFSAQESTDEDIEVSGGLMALTVALGFALAIGLFFAFPVWVARFVHPALLGAAGAGWRGTVALNVIEGAIRLSVFFIYLWSVSRMRDIQRVFEYHGAEHKTIHAYEAKDDMTPRAVDKYSTRHVRCGTSFLLLVMIVSIVIFSFLGRPESILIRIAQRVVVLPLVAGVAYEVTRYAGRHEDSRFVKIIMTPGLFLQSLTTREPSLDQLEVAIQSLQRLLVLEGMAPAAAGGEQS